MTTLAWQLIRAQSWQRLLITATCGAAATLALLIMVALLMLPEQPAELLFLAVADPSTRGGTVLALILLLAPVLGLAYQVALLGSAARARRFAVLQITGASPLQLRLLGAAMTAAPAAVGAALGIPSFFLLRGLIGGVRLDELPGEHVVGSVLVSTSPFHTLWLIPTSVTPAPWLIAAIVLVTIAGLGLMGWVVSRSTDAESATSRVRKISRRPPRPWGLALAAVGLGGFFLAVARQTDSTATMLVFVGIGAIGLLMSAPWIAYRSGTIVARRATTTSTVLGSSRVVADPRTAGRAAAPIAIVGLVVGGTSVIIAQLVVERLVETFYVVSILLVVALVFATLIFVAFAVAVRSVETLTEHRRPIAALAAAGVPEDEIESSLVTESSIVALPSVSVGVLLGCLPLLTLALLPDFAEAEWEGGGSSLLAAGLLAVAAAVVAGLVLTRLAVTAATRLVRPWLRAAMAADNLHTE